MTRPAKERPATEHLATLTRVLNQVRADKKMKMWRRQLVLDKLVEVIRELQDEVAGR